MDWRTTVLSNHSDGCEFGLVPADVPAEDLEYLEPKDAAYRGSQADKDIDRM